MLICIGFVHSLFIWDALVGQKFLKLRLSLSYSRQLFFFCPNVLTKIGPGLCPGKVVLTERGLWGSLPVLFFLPSIGQSPRLVPLYAVVFYIVCCLSLPFSHGSQIVGIGSGIVLVHVNLPVLIALFGRKRFFLFQFKFFNQHAIFCLWSKMLCMDCPCHRQEMAEWRC